MNRLLPHLLVAVCFWVLGSFTNTNAKTYVVTVGLGCYQNNWQNDLNFGRGDAKAIATIFSKHRDADVFMLLDDNATRDHILRVLKAKFSKAKPEDEIIFAYTGHGFDGGITGYGIDEIIYNYEIQNIMKASKAKRKMMFMGSCHSGSLAKKYEQNTTNNRNDQKNSNVILFLGSRPDESSWGWTFGECSFFITNVRSGLEGAADANNDRNITVRELFNYISPKVIDQTDGEQHPQILGQFDDDMVILKL